ncbi:ATP-binding protein [Streptomyces olivochromogenes]|uniref:ATP-binding protein n=1 Tax=Streptomyces olivochromogenes TaxID=1963 RepID=UPI001F3C1E73|nr:LuxR C-terminal-related transcriptional regulator [Streptomyces olivochromogenes]MCF3132559.1 LuxR family transcriptional regulator [Streptomyces olivochromogenes]
MGGSAPRRDAHLPVETTSFVDRREEQSEGRQLLAKARLVTLTGPGGVGKTRLAGRIAARVARAFPDGVRHVHLAGLHDPALVPLAAADALGLHDHSTQPALDALVEQVRDRRLLLVLDNCEHLLPACAELAAALLRGTTGVRVLATSRHRLGLTEEHLMEVRPLPVPDPDGDLSAAETHPALALFADRAAAVVPGFRLTPGNRAAVARLCRRLDGLPLAIELAAVRMRVLGIDQLLVRLDDRYRLLSCGSPAVLPRHQTLGAAVDWSHELCTGREQLVWARLSVLAGSFDLETAEAVCADDGETGGEAVAGTGAVRSYDVLEAVAGLVDKSVLCRESGPGGVRYRLLDTLRHYGLGKLRARPGDEAAARRRQRDWTQHRAAACERAWFGPDQREIVARLRADQDNLRAALDHSLSAPGEALAGLRLAGTLWFYWHACGAPREGRHWLDRALDANPEPTRERARALWVSALLAGSPEDLTRGLHRAQEARALAHRLGDEAEAAHADYVIGVVQLFADDLHTALTHYESTVARGRVPGQHLSLHGLDLVELACARAFLGESDRAVAVCEDALRLCEAHGEEWVRSYVLRILALAHSARSDWPRAASYACRALRLKLDVHDVIGIGLTLDLLALITAKGGDTERAAVLLGGADRVWSDIDRDRWGSTALNSARRDGEKRVREEVGERAYDEAYGRGGGLGLAGIVAYALRDPREPALRREPDPPQRLTRREREVAELVAEGLANQQIADRLVIARRTAEGHVERILGKLGFSNRSQIAAWVTAQR